MDFLYLSTYIKNKNTYLWFSHATTQLFPLHYISSHVPLHQPVICTDIVCGLHVAQKFCSDGKSGLSLDFEDFVQIKSGMGKNFENGCSKPQLLILDTSHYNKDVPLLFLPQSRELLAGSSFRT
jgi:hypothetical protein